MATWKEVRRAAVLAWILAMAAVTAAAAQDSPFRWSGNLGPGKVLEVEGISGSIRAERASGSLAEVVAEKDGRRSDFDDVEIRVEQHADGVTVCAIYRPERYGEDGCDPERRNHDDHRHSIRVDVDFVVKVPAGVELVASQVSGDVEARGLASKVTASSVSGDVSVSTTGVAEAHTVSGSLDIEMGSLDWDRLDFETVSGDITIRFPESLSADVDFSSLSGDLDSDFDLKLEGRRHRRWVGAHVRGTIGDEGRRSLKLNTVSGDVTLLRSR